MVVVVLARAAKEISSLDPGAEGKLPDEPVLVDVDSSEPPVISGGRKLDF
jgi:hypothetical protein